jgi:hypothetical protein
MTRGWVAGVVGLLLAGCNASTSDVGGGKLTATGCRSRVAPGDQMRIRAQWTAPKIARYTLVRLEGVGRFTIKSVVDETQSRGRPNGVSGEYDLPGPQSPATKKTIVAVIAANKASNTTITTRVWGSGNAVSTPPGNAASVSCAVVVTL